MEMENFLVSSGDTWKPDSGNMYPSSWRFSADGNGDPDTLHAAGIRTLVRYVLKMAVDMRNGEWRWRKRR